MDRCEPCRFVYANVDAKALPEHFASFGARYQAVLHAVHEGEHHLRDIERVLSRVRSRA
jgi:hypothetical protein